MATVTASQLSDIAEAAELPHSNVRVNYSGRGMFGRTCVGFDLGHAGELFSLGAAVERVLGDEAVEWGSPSTDSMGYGTIAYFRGLEFVAGDTWDADE